MPSGRSPYIKPELVVAIDQEPLRPAIWGWILFSRVRGEGRLRPCTLEQARVPGSDFSSRVAVSSNHFVCGIAPSQASSDTTVPAICGCIRGEG